MFAMLEASMDKENRQAVTRRSEHYRLDIDEEDEDLERARNKAEIEAKKEVNSAKRKALHANKNQGGGAAAGGLLDTNSNDNDNSNSNSNLPFENEEDLISMRIEAAEANAKSEKVLGANFAVTRRVNRWIKPQWYYTSIHYRHINAI